MAEVLPFTGETRHDYPAETILDQALEANLQGAVVLGYDADGKEYFASSYADGGTVLWLMERLKHRLVTESE